MSAELGFRVVIPARLASTRLPRKVLRVITGKPMIQHVFEQATRSGATEILIATDSEEVAEVCRAFGARAILTSLAHSSGTDRINEVAQTLEWPPQAIVINLQGDEPLMPPALIRQAAALLASHPSADLATLCHALTRQEDWLNPNIVKLVMDREGQALYFSRAPIPCQRGDSALPQGLAWRHIGLYAYRVGALARFSALPPSPLETCESLEQLRALENGLRIQCAISLEGPPRGVDTEADLCQIERLLSGPP